MFETTLSPVIIIVILLALVVLSFVVYELIKPDWHWTDMLSGIVEYIRKVTI